MLRILQFENILFLKKEEILTFENIGIKKNLYVIYDRRIPSVDPS